MTDLNFFYPINILSDNKPWFYVLLWNFVKDRANTMSSDQPWFELYALIKMW